jgi:hypothetical protein
MRHVVMTRSAYGPAWDLEANRRRLEITRGVTVASMAAQTSKDWTWIVAIDRNDPLKAERKAAFQSAGVPVKFLFIESKTTDRAQAAVEAYRAPWGKAIGKRDQVVAMTRLDDDDALAPWVVERIQKAAGKPIRTTILVLPLGIRVWGGRQTIVAHGSNAMQTLVTLPGDDLHVYGYLHRQARKYGKVRGIDGRLAWVWTRHPDTISGWHNAEKDIPDRMRKMFPIDWSLLEERRPNVPGPRGRTFR